MQSNKLFLPVALLYEKDYLTVNFIMNIVISSNIIQYICCPSSPIKGGNPGDREHITPLFANVPIDVHIFHTVTFTSQGPMIPPPFLSHNFRYCSDLQSSLRQCVDGTTHMQKYL